MFPHLNFDPKLTAIQVDFKSVAQEHNITANAAYVPTE